MASFLKQRLVGAIVLISLGIIFIPMLLTGRGDLIQGNAESNVPPKPAYEIKAPAVLPLEKKSKEEPAMAQVGNDASGGGVIIGEFADKTAESTPDAGQVATVALTDKTGAGGQSAHAANKTPEARDESSMARISQTMATTAESAKTDTVNAEPVKAPELKPQHPVKTASANPAEASVEASRQPIVSGWVVQLGSFSVEKNALKLRDKLRKNGHASFVEQYQYDGKTSYRVRVGPEQTRELADQLKTRLKNETQLNGLVMSFPR